MRSLQAFVLLLSLSVSSGLAVAGAEQPTKFSWLARIQAALDKAAEPYQIVPPTPVAVRWHPREIWSGELPGQLVDMIAVDLHGTGKSELVVLTSQDLVTISRKRGLFDIRLRAELPAKLAPIRSRDAIGSLSVVRATDGGLQLRARSSERAVGGTYQVKGDSISQVADFRGYPFCDKSTILASPGRNYWLTSRINWEPRAEGSQSGLDFSDRELADALYSARCTSGLIDPQGEAREYLSAVSIAGELRVYCEGSSEHCQALDQIVSEVGDAHVVTDVDNDGVIEIVHSSRTAPGKSDKVAVISKGPQGPVPIFEKEFAGGIVAIAAGDFAGSGAQEVVVAVRKGKSKRVSLWLLN